MIQTADRDLGESSDVSLSQMQQTRSIPRRLELYSAGMDIWRLLVLKCSACPCLPVSVKGPVESELIEVSLNEDNEI